MKRQLSYASVVLAGFLLAGCSGEPSASNIQKALEDKVEQSAKATAELFGMSENDLSEMTVQIHSVEKVACDKSTRTAGGFDCTVQIDSTVPFVGRHQETESLTFIEHKGKWSLVE